MKKQYVSMMSVFRLPLRTYEALLVAGPLKIHCRIGRHGSTNHKREGDGCTPRGDLAVMRGWWRTDRRTRPTTGLRLSPSGKSSGWCDAAGHGQYNRLVRLPFAGSHEEMWRSDRQYDVVLELGWNVRPRIQGRGSAIFLHLTSERDAGTAGCIAVPPGHINRLMARIGPRTRLRIH